MTSRIRSQFLGRTRLVLLTATLFASPAVHAQTEIIRDDTTEQIAGLILGNPSVYVIDGDDGVRRGNGALVLHSFERFNLAAGNAALITDTPLNLASVEIVLIRITGTDTSQLDGLILSDYPNAELLFVNSKGAFFGPNFTIDQRQGFHVSSADELELRDSISGSDILIDLSVATPIPGLDPSADFTPFAWRFEVSHMARVLRSTSLLLAPSAFPNRPACAELAIMLKTEDSAGGPSSAGFATIALATLGRVGIGFRRRNRNISVVLLASMMLLAATPFWLRRLGASPSMRVKRMGPGGLGVVGGGAAASAMKGSWASLAIGMATFSLPANAELTSPIYHEQYYQGEAELDGYAPGFVPNVVSFDLGNRPWIRDGLRIQRFNPVSGDWDSLDLVPSILAAYPTWTGLDDFGSRSPHQLDTRVVFDSQGDAYTFIASRGWTGIPVALLLHSRDDGLSWDVHPLPIAYRYARLEFSDAGLPLERPPAIVLTDDGQALTMLTPEKNPDGTLAMGSSVYLDANDPRLSPGGDGHSNFSLTRDGQTYVAYLSVSGFDGDGTPTWITRYDRDTGVLDPPVYLGDAGTGAPDNHNTPALTIDSQGYLHVVFGAHHQSFLYTRSLAPYSITGGWTAPVPIGADIDGLPAGADPACTGFCHQYTYVSLVRDRNDTLHLVARWAGTAGRTYFFRLSYLRKPASEGWGIREDLVVPFKAYYSNWYQKLSLDRSGRLFLFYIYYGNQLFSDEAAAYDGFWPEDGIEPEAGCTPTLRGPDQNYCWFNNVESHGPVLLRSEDAGSTWHTTTTADFQVAQLPALGPWGVGMLVALLSLLGSGASGGSAGARAEAARALASD